MTNQERRIATMSGADDLANRLGRHRKASAFLTALVLSQPFVPSASADSIERIDIESCRFLPGVKSYMSPSRLWTLTVKHSHPTLQGSAEYCLEHREDWRWVQNWCRTLPYVLCPAVLFDDGGIAGIAPLSSNPPDGGCFRVVAIAPSGEERMNDRTTYRQVAATHVRPSPRSLGMFVDRTKARLILWMDDTRGPMWVYDLSVGQRIRQVGEKELFGLEPKEHAVVCDAESVPDTDLILLQGVLRDRDNSMTCFALVDSEGQVIWQTKISGAPKRGSAGYPYLTCGSGHGRFIGAFDQPRSFRVRSVAQPDRAFELSKAAHGEWVVKERRKPPVDGE